MRLIRIERLHYEFQELATVTIEVIYALLYS